MLSYVVSAYAQSIDGDDITTGIDEPVKYTTLASSDGYSDSGADKLFDYDRDYKWCGGFTNKEEGETTNGAYVIFKTSRAMVPTYYTMVTAGDAQTYPARNWKQWQLYGMNADSDEDVTRESEKWVPLDKKYDVGTDQLPATNLTTVSFTLSEENTTAYRYFKIELDKIAGSTYCMQMADFLLGDEYTPKWMLTDEQGVSYTLKAADDGSYYYLVTGHSEELNTEIVIPANLSGCPVKAIENNVFYGCTSLSSITIPDGMTSIGKYAFSGCTGLTSITLPNSVTSIGEYAFFGCSNLTSVNIPDGVTSIGDYTFYNCALLTSINIPAGVTSVGTCAFYNCSRLTSINIPDGVTSIKDGSFCDCSRLTSINIPEGVTTIGNSAFAGCSRLTSINIPEGVTSIGNNVFNGCSNLTSVEIPEVVTSIGNYAFNGCSKLTSVEIPKGVTSIGDEAFYGCTSLTSIEIPKGVTSIGNEAFYGCTSLNDIKVFVLDYSEFCNNHIVGAFEKPIQLLDKDGNEITEYTIPDGVKTIGERAFQYCSGLSSITIPNSVITIGGKAFYCSGLTSVTIPNSVTTIGGGAFYGCYLSIVTSEILIPFDVSAFPRNSNSSLVVPKGLLADYKSVDGWNFGFAYEEGETIYVWNPTDEQGVRYTLKQADDDSYYYAVTGHTDEMCTEIVIPADIDGCPVKTIESWVFRLCSNLTSVTIPEGVTFIGDAAFFGCSSLSSVTIPNSVTTIDVAAFGECRNLTSVILGNQLTTIGNEAFKQCSSLTSITIPNSVTSIGSWAFYNCSRLLSVTIPNCVTTIGENAFNGCNGLKMITSEILTPFDVNAAWPSNATLVVPKGSIDAYKSVSGWNFAYTFEEDAIIDREPTDEQGVRYTLRKADDDSFYYAVTGHSDELSTEIVIPADLDGCPVGAIENYAFRGCSTKKYVIPGTVRTIGNNAFYDNYYLEEVEFNEGLLSIGSAAFEYNFVLKEIRIPSTVTTIAENAFHTNRQNQAKIYCMTATPPSIQSSTFGGRTDATLHVVATDINSYRDTENWKEFAEISGDLTYRTWCYPPVITCENDLLAMSCITEDAIIYYTTDGSNPDKNAIRYTSPISYSTNQIIRAIAVAEEMENSAVRNFYDREQIESVTDDQGLYYTLKQADDGSFYYAVTGHSDEMDTEIVISADLGGCPVKSIENAFNGCIYLSSVIIPKSVTTIGDNAFNGCTDLTSITIPNSVVSIGGYAFYNCNNLASVKIGKNVGSIGDYAFGNCYSLTSITLPDVLESIGNGAFSCTSLTSMNIPENVKTIGNNAFGSCGGLASVTFEEGITTIGERAFQSCALTSITIPNSVISLGSYAFSRCGNLTTAILGDGIMEIKGCTFEYCSALTSVTIPEEGVTSIGGHAFYGCYALTSIKLPETLTSLEVGAFNGCGLKSIELPDAFTAIPKDCFYSNNFKYIKLGKNVKSIGENAFGSSEPVIEIGTSTPPTLDKNAFPNVEYLSDITVIVPDAKAETAYRKKSVWEDMTFSNLTNICEVTVDTPGDLSWELYEECEMQAAKVVGLKVNGIINDDDFTQMLVNMKSLLRLDLSDCEITEIPDNALNGKTQLQELTLPNTLQTIGKNAFRDCPYLTGELTLPSTLTSIGDYAFVGTYYTSVKLPSTLKAIGNYAFNKLPLEQRLVLPERMNSVGAYAFAGTKITGLVIRDGLTSIGDNAFADTPIKGHVTIPDGVTYLGSSAFRNTQISTVFLPNSITTLSYGLFQGCPNLNTVYVPDNYTAMSNYAFDGCGSLSILRLSANTTSMGEYTLQNTPLDYLKVPSQVEVLSRGVLKNCKQLESLTLPANLKSIEAEALYGCTALRNMSVEAVTPPTIKDRSVIRGINTDKCLISIPTSAYRNYVLAEYWGQFVQMRNDIAVETEGNGEIAFESVEEEEEEENDEENLAPRRAGIRAPQLASDEESMTFANNGSSVYVPKQGKVRFYIIPGEGEELVSATLDGEDIMPYIVDGVYTATADKKNAKLVVKFTGQGSAIKAGDVNNDGYIDVADLTGVVRFILDDADESLVFKAADMDESGIVEINDYSAVVNIILNQDEPNTAPQRRTDVVRDAVISLSDVCLNSYGEGELVVRLDQNNMQYTGLQFDLRLPDGIELVEGGAIAIGKQHDALSQKRTDGTYRVICASMLNKELREGDVMRLQLKVVGTVMGDAEAVASEVVLSDVHAVRHEAASVKSSLNTDNVSGIEQIAIGESQTDDSVYNLSGQRVQKMEKGIYIVNGKKVVIK